MVERKRRSYTPEFKLEAVKLLSEQGITFADASEQLDVTDQVLRNWKAKYDAEGESAFLKGGNGHPTEAEVRRLREENRRLRERCNVLKQAAAVFAQDIV